MRRDGRSLGILRSFWRAVLLYLPLLLVVYLVSYCNAAGYEYLWWGISVVGDTSQASFLCTTLGLLSNNPHMVSQNTVRHLVRYCGRSSLISRLV
jgi:hypothetical protein